MLRIILKDGTIYEAKTEDDYRRKMMEIMRARNCGKCKEKRKPKDPDSRIYCIYSDTCLHKFIVKHFKVTFSHENESDDHGVGNSQNV